MSITNLSPSQLRTAADLQEKIVKLQSELAAILGSESKAAPTAKPAKKKGMSAAGRAKVAAAQKARWAKINAAKAKTAPKAAKPAKKKGMSAEGRAKIVAAQKARWAKIKAAKPSTKVIPATKTIAKVVAAAKPAKKKGMSAAAKANQSAKMKAYWAAKKAVKN